MVNDRKNDKASETRDGEPLRDRGAIDAQDDLQEDEMPVDESDDGPQPVLTKNTPANK